MAKPMPVPYAESPRRQEKADTPKSTRPRRPRRQAKSSPSPSSTVLSLLATVVASSTSACATPAPLSFLYPSLGFEGPHPTPPEPTPAAVVPQYLHKRSRGHRPGHSSEGRRLADKFQYDSETGWWKRVETWTLYGSTVCPSCPQASTSMSVDDQIQPPATSTSSATDTSATSTAYNFEDTLPPGWNAPKPTSPRVTYILVGSLILAAAILFLTISCLFWRKNRHRARRKDVEMKSQRRRSGQSRNDEEANTELIVKKESKEAKVKYRIWVRATARWKAHAHYNARQRRGRRSTVPRNADARSSTTSLTPADHPPEPSNTVVAQSPSPSRRSSMESMYMEDPGPSQNTNTSLSPTNTDPMIARRPSRLSFSSDSASLVIPAPPAYRQQPNSSTPKTSLVQHPVQVSDTFTPSHEHRTSLASYSSSDPNPDHTLRQGHVAHVATDDKTVLARLANLASAPPVDGPSNPESSSELEVSAPVWEDQQLEDFGETENSMTSNHLTGSSSNAPLFPPTPSKGKMAEAGFYHEYEMEEPSPESFAAAPPFQVDDPADQPSYPPLDDSDLVPSAPPLADEPDSLSIPSAPPLPDWTSESEPEEGQVSTAEGIAALSSEHFDTSTPSPIPVYGPMTSDGTPPCYYR